MKAGDFSSLDFPLVNPWTGMPFLNNKIPESMFHPAAVRMLATIPDPNRNDPDRNFVNNQPEINNQDTITAQIDWNLGEDSKLFANYSLRNNNGFEVNPLPAFGLTSRGREQSVFDHYCAISVPTSWLPCSPFRPGGANRARAAGGRQRAAGIPRH